MLSPLQVGYGHGAVGGARAVIDSAPEEWAFALHDMRSRPTFRLTWGSTPAASSWSRATMRKMC